jgi:MFS family permease
VTAAITPAERRSFLAPLALAQFICSFAGSNINVMINDITEDRMIPCGKLSERWGRKRCFTAGVVLYGIEALLSAASPGLGVLILGNSILERIGTALLLPKIAWEPPGARPMATRSKPG